MSDMPRAATTSDVYNAIAEPHRRAILELVYERERAVNEVVEELDLRQPSVSKHLRVLKEVNLVTVRRRGRQRLYSANPEALKPVDLWVRRFERFWNHQLDTIRARAELGHSVSKENQKKEKEKNDDQRP